MSKDNRKKLMEAYQLVGLDEDFSRAIVEGGNAEHIVDTWKASWRNGHSAEHPATKAVLSGKATPDEAKSLIDAAKNHRDLVDAVANGEKNMTWAHAVLSSGFSGNKKAVTALLNGADPTIIARVLDIALSKDAIKIINRGGRSSNRKDSNEKKWTVAEINKMTKPQAVAHLSKYNISYTGNQALLINRVQRHRILVTQISQSLLKTQYKSKVNR